MPASAEREPTALRRWRVSLAVLAWLLLVQSAAGLVLSPFAVLALRAFGLPGTGELVGSLRMLGADVSAVTGLFGQVELLTCVSVGFNVLVLVGSIGLVRRERWGWFLTILVHVAAIGAGFVWGLPIMRSVLGLVTPDQAGAMSLLITVLTSLVPASIVGFLMLDGVVRQFRRPATRTPESGTDG